MSVKGNRCKGGRDSGKLQCSGDGGQTYRLAADSLQRDGIGQYPMMLLMRVTSMKEYLSSDIL